MKNILFRYLVFALFLSFGITACNDFEDENYDFSNSLPQYVELSSGAPIEAVAGDEVSATVQVRVALQSTVTVNYEITGDISETGTIEIPADEVSGTYVFNVPTTPDTGTATLKLTAVDNGLSLGRGAEADGLSALEVPISWAP